MNSEKKKVVKITGNALLVLIGIIGFGVMEASLAFADMRTVVMRGQENLKKLRYYTGGLDGVIGRKTKKAILHYQIEMNLPATGALDEATIKHLRRPALILITQDFAPFHYKTFEGGKIGGPVPQIIKLVCNNAGINCRFFMYEQWKVAQEDVRSGKADGLFVIAWNSEREKWLHRSQAIMKTEYGIFVTKSDPLQLEVINQQPSMLNGYKVGVYGPSGTSNSLNRFKNTLANKGVKFFVEMETDDKPLFKKLSSLNEKYAVYSNKLVGETIIRGMQLDNTRYAGKHRDLYYYVGFSKKRVPLNVVKKFNEAYLKLEKDGTIFSIMANHRMHSIEEADNDSKQIIKEKTAEETPSLEEETPSFDRFNKITKKGISMVFDTKECLMWEQSGSDKYVDWVQAFAYVEKLNKEKHAGFSNWRLPRINELSDLIENRLQRENRLYINPIFDGLQQACWSSDLSKNGGVQFVDYFDGAKASKDQKDSSFVRAVRNAASTECIQQEIKKN